ncbi:TPA: hypothetical protein ACH3X3_014576 [Trebouxia sp. C0006]
MGDGTDPIALPADPGNIPIPATVGPSLNLKPVAGIPLKDEKEVPKPGQVVIGYEVYEPKAGCCETDSLTASGKIAVLAFCLCCWSLAWIPCILPSCHERYQRPVYGDPELVIQPASPAGAA